jgi:hypothetical protein
MSTDVPEPLRPIVHNFKQALIATVDATLLCNDPAATEAASIQSSLISRLHANLPAKPFVPQPRTEKWPESEKGTYGTDLTITVKSVPEQPGLISIQIAYGIECGDDNILLLYRHTPGKWQRELLWQNPDLNTIGDAFGDFFLFSVVPSNSTHPYLIAVAHGQPWCTSNMSGIRVDLLAPSGLGKPQQHLSHVEEIYFRPDAPRLQPTLDGLEIRATVYAEDTERIMRSGVYRFRTTAGTLERVQPIANNARDFVDEWLQIPWSEAAEWSAPPLSALKSIHDRFDYKLRPATNGSGGAPTIEAYGPVRACTSADRGFQVEIDLSDASPTAPASKLYAIVSQSPTAFTMLSINSQPDPACHGPDIMKPR